MADTSWVFLGLGMLVTTVIGFIESSVKGEIINRDEMSRILTLTFDFLMALYILWVAVLVTVSGIFGFEFDYSLQQPTLVVAMLYGGVYILLPRLREIRELDRKWQRKRKHKRAAKKVKTND